MDKAETTVVAKLQHYDKHYNLALFKVSMDLYAQMPSFTSELKFAEEIFVLGRDEGRYLTIDDGNVSYNGPSMYQRHHYMFINRRINKV
jgi:small nuclear ribonucleoprotein (snRNP)-like protein